MTTMTVKERPILFSGPMVRAILAGQKTQTRRIVKPQPTKRFVIKADDGNFYDADGVNSGVLIKCPFEPGMQLWIKETWRLPAYFDPCSPTSVANRPKEVPVSPIKYEADRAVIHEDNLRHFDMNWGKTRVSIHMPRWANRITLEVTNVRIERLKQITPSQIQLEGFEIDNRSVADGGVALLEQFARLWESLNGKNSWELNPWVWVVEFKRTN